MLGTVFEVQTGITLEDAFSAWITGTTGMEDFVTEDVRYQVDEVSGHPMYRFYMSARDMARFGMLYSNEGLWQGQQIITSQWVAVSFEKYSEVPYSSRSDGHGLLWWINSAELFYGGGVGWSIYTDQTGY